MTAGRIREPLIDSFFRLRTLDPSLLNRKRVSDTAVSTPRDATNVSTELHGLLMAANIGAPVVLVGHSIAGLYIREYAVRKDFEAQPTFLTDSH